MIERYSRPEMANIWTEENKYRAWLEVEILADEAWAELGEIPKEDVALIREKADFDIDRILEIEQQTRHDGDARVLGPLEELGDLAGSRAVPLRGGRAQRLGPVGARNGFLQFDAELLVFATRGVEASANRSVVPPVGCADVCLGHGHLEARLTQVFLGDRKSRCRKASGACSG